MNTHKSHTDTALTEEIQKREEKFLLLFFSACIDKIAINSTKRRAEKNENKSAEVEQMSEKSIVVLFYYFSCVIHLDVKKSSRENAL